MFNCLHKLVFFIHEKQDIFIPGGKFLGLIDDFRMETTNIVAKATPIKKNADISALTPFKFNIYTCLKNSSDSWSTTQTTNSENLVFQLTCTTCSVLSDEKIFENDHSIQVWAQITYIVQLTLRYLLELVEIRQSVSVSFAY